MDACDAIYGLSAADIVNGGFLLHVSCLFCIEVVGDVCCIVNRRQGGVSVWKVYGASRWL